MLLQLMYIICTKSDIVVLYDDRSNVISEIKDNRSNVIAVVNDNRIDAITEMTTEVMSELHLK